MTIKFYKGDKLEAILDLGGLTFHQIQEIIEVNLFMGRRWEFAPREEEK